MSVGKMFCFAGANLDKNCVAFLHLCMLYYCIGSHDRFKSHS